MMSLGALLLLAVTLVGQTSAIAYCCKPGCTDCSYGDCGNTGFCTNPIFNTCCAEEKKAIMFEGEEDYLAAAAAGEVGLED